MEKPIKVWFFQKKEKHKYYGRRLRVKREMNIKSKSSVPQKHELCKRKIFCFEKQVSDT